ncbi:unnamed protein product [Paramecium sonneborni]|uniref:Uncharacterized protein n=1 Tax=Paramecium sonneborni TaxID=65129 RepID=A0A8S1P828_9CILI|nr:unnamed protein product [Paramecium sonneborni]
MINSNKNIANLHHKLSSKYSPIVVQNNMMQDKPHPKFNNIDITFAKIYIQLLFPQTDERYSISVYLLSSPKQLTIVHHDLYYYTKQQSRLRISIRYSKYTRSQCHLYQLCSCLKIS